MNNDLMFSSATGKWDTLADLIADLATVFDWDCDVCASSPNVCDFYYDEEDDGLIYAWDGLCWMNPPYGRQIGKWVTKAQIEGVIHKWASVVCLIPARTDTQWWHDNVRYASQVVFIRGRLKFGTKESWIRSYQEQIMKPGKTPKQINALVRKIGGALCEYDVWERMHEMWDIADRVNPLPWSLDEWLQLSHIKIDSAPFPSAFVVFGYINDRQRMKLASYGWSFKP